MFTIIVFLLFPKQENAVFCIGKYCFLARKTIFSKPENSFKQAVPQSRSGSSSFVCTSLTKHLRDFLFSMTDAHLDAELLVDMLSQMLRTIHRAMLTTRTTEAEH